MSNEKATGLGYLDPNILSSYVKEQLRQPMYESMGSFANQMINPGQAQQQTQSPQEMMASQVAQPGSTMPIGSQVGTQGVGKPGVGAKSEQIGGLNPGAVNLPKKMTPQMAQMVIKENSDLRNLQEKRRGHDLKQIEINKDKLRKKYDEVNAEKEALSLMESNLSDVENAFATGQPISDVTQKVLRKLGISELITNPTTQQLNKSSAALLLSTVKNIKGMSRLTNWIGQMAAQSKLNEFNTPEGAAAIAEGQHVVIDGLKEIAALKKSKLDEFDEDPLNMPSDWQKGLDKQIDEIQKKIIAKSKTSIYKHAGFTSNTDMVETPPDPKSFDTRVNGEIYVIDGKKMASDGKKWREAKYDADENGNPIRFLGFKD